MASQLELVSVSSALFYESQTECISGIKEFPFKTDEPYSSPPISPKPQLNAQGTFIPDALHKRTAAFPIEKLPGSLPKATIAEEIDHAAISSSSIEQLNHFNIENFTGDTMWRDLLAMTGTFRTFNGAETIKVVWKELADRHRPCRFTPMPGTSKIVRLPTNNSSWIQARYSFETSGTPATLCSGHIGIVPESSGWKIWLLTTILEEIKGFPNPDFIDPKATAENPPRMHRASKKCDYECVVVGAGFAGLCLGGRLKAMGVSYLMLERNPSIGDNWTNRYDSARYHTSKDYSDMPLSKIFTKDDPYFLSSKDLARGFENYADQYNLNVWTSTALESADFNPEDKTWTLHIIRTGEKSTLRTPHFVLAVGGGGVIPSMPLFPNREQFKGIVLHSATYQNSDAWTGKRGIVIGSANTAHDVAEDMLDAGLSSVTMVQRGRTSVFPIEYYKAWADKLYNSLVPTEEADRETMAVPMVVSRLAANIGHNYHASKDQERFDALERVGFRVERYGDIWKLLTEKQGGHYMDVGCSAKIAAGLIKMKGDAAPVSYTNTGLKFSDGSTLDADVIVFCTGFNHDMQTRAIQYVGSEIGERLEPYWKLDDEGEVRGAYKTQSYPGIWYHGGSVTYARFYSRFVALQIRAASTGVPLQRYTKKFVHSSSLKD